VDINIHEATHKKSKNAKRPKQFVGTKTSERGGGRGERKRECVCVCEFEIKKS